MTDTLTEWGSLNLDDLEPPQVPVLAELVATEGIEALLDMMESRLDKMVGPEGALTDEERSIRQECRRRFGLYDPTAADQEAFLVQLGADSVPLTETDRCIVPGCPRDARSIGRYCQLHLRRLSRLGSTDLPERDAKTAELPAVPGQAFLDLLILGAVACQTPLALLSVPQADGSWNTLSYGFERKEGLDDPVLFAALAPHPEIFEIEDLLVTAPKSPLVQPPYWLRWACGAALRSDGNLVGVVAVLDRVPHNMSKLQRRALLGVGRQLTTQLSGTQRSAPAPVPSPVVRPPSPVPLPPRTMCPGCRRPLTKGTTHNAGECWADSKNHARPRPTDAESEPEIVSLLNTRKVAAIFGVTTRTVMNWARSGQLRGQRTAGGHFRFRPDAIETLLSNTGDERSGR